MLAADEARDAKRCNMSSQPSQQTWCSWHANCATDIWTGRQLEQISHGGLTRTLNTNGFLETRAHYNESGAMQ